MNKDIENNIVRILKKIRETRKTKGFTHENMAHELNMSPSAYNKLEQSKTILSLERLLRIKEILELDYNDLFEIRTGDTFNQDLKDNSVGRQELKDNSIAHVENLYTDNKEITEKLIQTQQSEIHFLRDLLAKSATSK